MVAGLWLFLVGMIGRFGLLVFSDGRGTYRLLEKQISQRSTAPWMNTATDPSSNASPESAVIPALVLVILTLVEGF